MADPSERISQLKIDRSARPHARNTWLWPVLIVLTIAGATLWWLSSGAARDAAVIDTELVRQPPSESAANSVLDASGYVVARRQATVSSKVTGKVLDVFVEEGMRVEQDQILAKLDDSSERAQLALAIARVDATRAALAETRAQLQNAKLQRDRLRDLADKSLVSKSSLDDAEAAYDELAARLATGRENVVVAKRNVGIMQDALSNTSIRAPFAGMVVSKNAQPGEMISPVSAGGGFTRTGICTIIDTDSLEIEVDVNEAYIQRVQAGQRVAAVLDAYPDWRIPSKVIAIIPTADRQKATVRVRIGFDERDPRILRDMGAKVSFLGAMSADGAPSMQGVTISRGSLQSDTQGDFVWLVRNNVVERRPVSLGGPRDSPRVLIVAGLVAGDTVVRSSQTPLAPGIPIQSQVNQ